MERAEAKEKRIKKELEKKKLRDKKASSVAHILRALKEKYGNETKFSVGKVKQYLKDKGVASTRVNKIKMNTVISDWSELAQ